jgi:hypothetical protein
MTQPRLTRAERLSMPLARHIVRDLAAEHGGCVRPVQLRRTDLDTGQVAQVLVPCGHTLADTCPACAERNKALRAAQCREGWHLDFEPAFDADEPDESQKWWTVLRSEAQQMRDHADQAGQDTADLDELTAELDSEMTNAGIRGNVLPTRAARRHRSTRRRQDAPDLPTRPRSARTIGRTYTAPDGTTWRPSMFLTLTCNSYGRVNTDGTPADPGGYDYQRAARDAIHFAALFDRLIQNLRRYLGYDLQYFAVVEPQKRLAPHVHVAIRGTIPRAELREVLAATYHQVWWPQADDVVYDETSLPVWHESTGRYIDADTGEFLPSWDDALDAIGPYDLPLHTVRFGSRFDAKGLLAGTKDTNRAIGYLTKYLTKQLGQCHRVVSDRQADHADRLADALRYEPCSPTCANWLRYGITPKNPREGLRPGRCTGKAHRREYLGYAGRRVLVSRKWSGKTLADHRADRKAWLLATLGIAEPDPARYSWQLVAPGDSDHMPPAQRLLHVVADRIAWQSALGEARRRAAGNSPPDLSATGRAA